VQEAGEAESVRWQEWSGNCLLCIRCRRS